MSASDDLLAQAGFVRLLVRDLVRDEHEAADVAQEVALSELRRPSTLTGSPAAWLTVVARRIARKFHRAPRSPNVRGPLRNAKEE